MELAVAGVAVLGSYDRSRHLLKYIRIGLGAVAPTPIRARKAENILQSCFALQKNIDEKLIYSIASFARPKEIKDVLEDGITIIDHLDDLCEKKV